MKEAGIDRAAAAMALFEKRPRKAPLIGKVVGVGMVDEITDRTWVVVDAVDGRVHYAELGRLKPADVPARGMLVALAGDEPAGQADLRPRLQVLSAVEIERQATYDGPTWLDQAIIGKCQVRTQGMPGFAAELRQALAARGRWLAERELADVSAAGEVAPKPEMMSSLRQPETSAHCRDLSRQLNAIYFRTSRAAAFRASTSARSRRRPASSPSSAARTPSRWRPGSRRWSRCGVGW